MFIVEEKPKSVATEAYKNLRTNIQYSSFDKDYKTIVVTSSEPAEGKSSTAGNLALALAQGENKVLLIDCDMRKPSIHKSFLISNSYGLSDLLITKEKLDNIVYKHSDNLYIVTSGKIPPNPSEMLGSNAMGAFLRQMKEHFDYIILDTPPVLAVTDAQILSTKCDGVVLVVRAGRTKRDNVLNSVNSIKKVNGHIIGTVLNGIELKKDSYYYYYGNEEHINTSGKKKKNNIREKEVIA